MLDEQPGQRVWVIEEFLSRDECAALVLRAEVNGFHGATIQTGRVSQEVDVDIRNNARTIFEDDGYAEQLWLKARPCLPKRIKRWHAVGMHERLRFYRYDSDERFAPHIDGPSVRSCDEKSRLTFMVYLSDGFEGGQTVFYDEEGLERLSVEPRLGMALVFEHNQLHEGAPVTRGRKYVMRTDVMYWLREE